MNFRLEGKAKEVFDELVMMVLLEKATGHVLQLYPYQDTGNYN